MIKKFLLVCTGLFVLFNSSCIYIGLFSNEIKILPALLSRFQIFLFQIMNVIFIIFLKVIEEFNFALLMVGLNI